MQLTISSFKRQTFILLFGLFFWILPNLAAETLEKDPFPVFESIKPNIAFWTKIYSQYHTRQGVIHDAENLNIIYEIVHLKPLSQRNSRRLNRKLLKTTKQKYRNILSKLATGNPANSEEEKRVAKLFGPNPDPTILLEAMDKIRFQRGQKDRFQAGIIRSGRFIKEIRTILKSYGLPEDLAYLPHVESSYNYEAYSKFGAAGIWQFTYRTGKRYMKIDYAVDERRDPIIAAHAAAKLLQHNHKQLGG